MRALIAAELRRFPDLPSRWLAKIVGVCDKTVESVRQELIATAGIPQFDRLKGRHFPSRPSIQIMTMTAREAERAQEAIRMVSEAATREPERHGKLVDRMNKSGPFNGVVRDLRIAEEAQKIRCEPQPLPTGPFRVAVVVPPWMYDAKCSPSRRAVTNYPVMTAEQIKAVEVPSIMEVDSVVWLWITNQHLAECAGAEILRHWGYRPVSLLTWD
jgi:hypothetical protein